MNIRLDPRIRLAELSSALEAIGVRTRYRDGALVVVKRIPVAEFGAWCPVSEPPELLVDVLVTVIDEEEGVPVTEKAYLRKPGRWHLTDIGKMIQPTAWMPLPKPYGGPA